MNSTRALGVVGAVLAAVLVWVAGALLDVELSVDMRNGQPPQVIGLGFVVGSSLVSALLGWAALALLERFTARGRTVWTWLAGAVLLVSFVPVLAAEASPAAKAVLGLMHLAVAAVLIPVLRAGAASRGAAVEPV